MAIERIKWVDALKFFAIFLVLWGHAVQHLSSADEYDSIVYAIIYTFHMPLFMALSGFFADKLKNYDFRKVLKTKFRQLLLPFISAYSIIIILILIFGRERYLLDKEFWFLPSAFFCSILFYISSYYKKYFWIFLFLSLLISQFIGYYRIPSMYPCFVLGALLNRYFDILKKYSRIIFLLSACVFAILLFGLRKEIYVYSIENFNNLVKDLPFHSPNFVKIYTRAYKLIIGLAGTLMFVSLFEYLSRNIKQTKLGDKIVSSGQYTLGIYIFQTFILEILLAQLLDFSTMNIWVFNLVIAPLISIVVLFICLSITKLVKMNKYIAFLFLGEKIKKK